MEDLIHFIQLHYKIHLQMEILTHKEDILIQLTGNGALFQMKILKIYFQKIINKETKMSSKN